MVVRVRLGLGGHLLLLLAMCSELTDGVPSAAELGNFFSRCPALISIFLLTYVVTSLFSSVIGKATCIAQEVMHWRRWIGFVRMCSRECFVSIETHFRRF